MSRDDERMRALVAGYRRAIAPRANDRARVWARLEDDSELPQAPAVSTRRTVAIACACAVAAGLLLFALRPSAQTTPASHGRDDGQSVYDLQDEERRKADRDEAAPEDRARRMPPDSNAM